MHIMLKRWSWLILLLLPWWPVMAQQPEVRSVLDTSSIRVGEQTRLNLTVECSRQATVTWPEIADTLRAEIEVLSRTNIDTGFLASDRVLYSQQLVITSFDSGYYAVPPFRFLIDAGGITQELETMAHLLEVHTVAVDTTANFRDILPVNTIPITFREVFPWVFAGLIVVILLLFFIVFLRRRKKAANGFSFLPHKPNVPPHREALDALDELKSRKIWQKGNVKGFYSAITDILRVYLEKQFDLHAVEMSTTEILEQVHDNQYLSVYYEEIASVFTSADLVKFARVTPLPQENEDCWTQSVHLVIDSHKRYVAICEENAALNDSPASDGEEMRKEGSDVECA